MNRILIVFLGIMFALGAQAQNLELRNGKDIYQPGKLNPALAGIQEDLAKLLSGVDAAGNYELMLEGKIPFKLGNYMIGYERFGTNDVANNVLNITYGRTVKSDGKGKNKSPFEFRYGGSLQFNKKELVGYGQDTSGVYSFIDLNGDVRTVPTLDQTLSNVDYFNFELGASMSYHELFMGVSLENIIKQNVSLVENESRNIPLTANLVVGGFLDVTKEFVVFPSLMAVYTQDDIFGKASVNLAIKEFNLASAYTFEDEVRDLSASVGYRFKKSIVGINYTHPLTDVDQLPRFELYFNSSLLKGLDVFKSDFAKHMKHFY